jgi:2-desacetyl-2-hydroxyethyl bacteriochlorophyllide A dehydrogenase
MQTLILAEPGRFMLTTTEPPADPAPGFAVVRVRRIGVCGTDLHAFRGRQPFFEYPRILGHELGVEVVKIGPGSDTDLQPGDRCAVEPYMNCGTCIACRQGNTNACATLNVIGVHSDGGMREYITVPVHKLHRSMGMSFEQLALVETLGIGAHAVRRSQLRPDEWALVIGAGPIGLTVMQFALLAGAKVIVLDLEAKRLEFCQAQLGVQHIVQAGDDALEQVRQLTGGDMPTVVFDATGSEQSMNNAFNYVAQCGKLVFVGLFKGHVTFNDPEFHRRELTLFASRNATSGDLRNVIAQIEAGKIDTTSWITHRAPLAEAGDHFDSWTRRDTGVIKAVISVGD